MFTDYLHDPGVNAAISTNAAEHLETKVSCDDDDDDDADVDDDLLKNLPGYVVMHVTCL